MSKEEYIQYLKDNKKGILTTGLVTAGVISSLVATSIFSKENTQQNNINAQVQINQEDELLEHEQVLDHHTLLKNKRIILPLENQPDFISLSDTREYKVIKVTEEIEDFKNSFTKYYIVKEFYFPYAEELAVKNLYTLVDIMKNETILYRDEDYEVITPDNKPLISYVELGSLTDYLVEYGNIKENYKKEEFQTILEKLDNENQNKISFDDTLHLNILELENKKTGELSWHIVSNMTIDVDPDSNYMTTGYIDMMKDKLILEVDPEDEVINEYQNYSYELLGSLTEYLVTHHNMKPEYDKNEFNDILKKIENKRKPAEKKLK